MAIQQELIDLTDAAGAGRTGKRLPAVEARVVAITDVPPGCNLRISFDGHTVNPIRIFNPKTFTFPSKVALNVHVYYTQRSADADPDGDTSRRYAEILFTDGEHVVNGGSQRMETIPAPADVPPLTGQFVLGGSEPTPIPEDVACEEVQIKSPATENAGKVLTVGGSDVEPDSDGTGNGDVVDPGERIGFATPRSGLVYVHGPAGAVVVWKILPRRK